MLQLGCKVLDPLPVFARLFMEVDAIDRPRTRLCEGQGHLKADPTVSSGHERDAVREGELLREECRLGR